MTDIFFNYTIDSFTSLLIPANFSFLDIGNIIMAFMFFFNAIISFLFYISGKEKKSHFIFTFSIINISMMFSSFFAMRDDMFFFIAQVVFFILAIFLLFLFLKQFFNVENKIYSYITKCILLFLIITPIFIYNNINTNLLRIIYSLSISLFFIYLIKILSNEKTKKYNYNLLIISIIFFWLCFTFDTFFKHILNSQENISFLGFLFFDIIIIRNFLVRFNKIYLELENSSTSLKKKEYSLKNQLSNLENEKCGLKQEISKKNQEILEKNIELKKTNNILIELNNDLAESQAISLRIINALLEGILIHENGIILEINSSLLKLTKYSKDNLIGSSIFNYISKKYHKKVASIVDEEKGKPYEIELIDKYERTIIVEIYSRPMKYKGKDARVASIRNITDLKYTQQILQQRKEQLKAVYSNSAVGVIIGNLEGDFLDLNATWCNMIGYTSEELLQMKIWDLIVPSERNEFIDQIQDFALSQKNKRIERKLIRKNGSQFWGSISLAPLLDENKNLSGAIGIIVDITDLKEIQKKLEKAEKKYRNIYENSPIGIFGASIKGNFLNVNPECAKIFGYKTPEEMLSKTKENSLNIYANKHTWLFIRANLIKYGQVKDYEAIFLKNNGEKIWLSLNAKTVKSRKGKLFIDGFIYDITQRKRVEKERKESIEQKELVTDGVPAHIAYINNKLDYLYVNKSYNNLNGLKNCNIIGKNITDILSKEILQEEENYYKRVLKGEKIDFESIERKNEKGEKIYMTISFVPHFDEDNKVKAFFVMLQDVTSLKISEMALRKAKEEAEKANKAKSQFLANMSHEIRTPMNAIVGFSDILSKHIKDDKLLNYLNSIQTSSNTLLSIINDILDLSKIEAGKLQLEYNAVCLSRIVKEVSDIFFIKISEKQLDFQIEILPKTIEYIYIDEVRIRQILLNLIGNAVKFTEKGFIKIRVYNNKTFTKDKTNYTNLIFEVIDSGIGILKNEQENIFEAFRQQDNQSTKKYGGTGLGLSITKRLIDMMNGHIFLESKVGEGSLFKIVFDKIKIPKKHEINTLNNNINLKNINLENFIMLLVDDIEDNRELVKEYCRETKINIIEAENGQEAIEKTQKYNFDIILMDIKMPVMDGFKTIKKIRNNNDTEDIPTVAMSASAMKHEKENIEQSLFNDFLEKPIKKNDLLKQLTQYIGNKKSENNKHSKINFSKEFKTEVIEYLNTEITPYWEIIKKSNRLKDIKNFTDKLKSISPKYNIYIIELFTKELNLAVKSFDIEKMSYSIKNYPNLIEKINQL